ncbi:unannotated protein [freshwater metagenome]|uniref:Unannotated protein n=1 Tax=freshwater metagenome TaxID=449393 RepID=A0A6J6I7N3_9ZZZZ
MVVPTHLMPSHGLAQFRDSDARWVLVSFARSQRLNGSFANGFRTIGVGKSLAQVDRIGRKSQRGHLSEDSRAEAA